MEKDDAITYRRLDPEKDVIWYVLAYRWTQDRPRLFPHTGGFDLLVVYLDRAKKNSQVDVAVFEGEKMITLITIQKESNGGYLFHVTSPKGSDPVKITAATYEIGWDLFDKMDAAFIYTMVPTFNGHVHKGSKMLAESCGLTLCGEPEVEIDGRWHYSWQPYSLTREDWTKYHGKTENTAIAV